MDVFSVGVRSDSASDFVAYEGSQGFVGMVEDAQGRGVRISSVYSHSWQAKRWALSMVGKAPGRYTRWGVVAVSRHSGGVVNESLPLPVASLEIPKSSRFAARGPFSGYMPGGRALRVKVGAQ